MLEGSRVFEVSGRACKASRHQNDTWVESFCERSSGRMEGCLQVVSGASYYPATVAVPFDSKSQGLCLNLVFPNLPYESTHPSRPSNIR